MLFINTIVFKFLTLQAFQSIFTGFFNGIFNDQILMLKIHIIFIVILYLAEADKK